MGLKVKIWSPRVDKKTHLWDAQHEPSSSAHPRLQRRVHQTEALSQPFDMDMDTCGLLVVFLDKIGPSTPHRRH